jgi:phosphatidylglycerol:prolipoprotein diacylglycerol transferase
MYPTLYELPNLPGGGLHSWGLMVMLGFLGAFVLTGIRARAVGMDPDKLVPLYLLSCVAGLLGARLLHFMLSGERADFFENPMIFFDPDQGGFAFYGGAIGGILAGAIYAKLRNLHVWKLGDIAAAAIMLGLGLGRMGCFFAGCCHGGVCEGSETGSLADFQGGRVVSLDEAPYVGLIFNKGVGVGAIHDVPTWPTQMVESLGALTLFLILSLMWKYWRRFDGQILASMLGLYAIMRASIERFRGDSIRGLHDFGGMQLSTSQLVAGVMVMVAVLIALLRFHHGVASESPFEPEGDELLV